ncbi:MAG: hypothetical protein ABR909_13715 [Candidatus Bathyarchaeia archaeon]
MTRALTSWSSKTLKCTLYDFEKAEINGEPLTAHFEGKRNAKIQLSIDSPSILQEIKEYIFQPLENVKYYL